MGDTRPRKLHIVEEGRSGQGSAPRVFPGSDEPRVGDVLRSRRLSLGYDLQEVAVALRIRFAYLEAIEEGRFNDLPGAAYVSGFLRTYAEHLGLDPQMVLRRFKEESSGALTAKPELYLPKPVPEGRIPGGALLLVAVLLAAIAVRLGLAPIVVLAGLVKLLAFGHFLLRLAQHPRVVLGVLEEALLGDAVAGELRVTGQREVFLDDLLGGAAHLALGAGAVEHAVHDIAQRALVAGLVARTGLGRSHRANFDWSGAGSAWMRLGSDPADRPGPPARRFAEISGNGTCAG